MAIEAGGALLFRTPRGGVVREAIGPPFTGYWLTRGRPRCRALAEQLLQSVGCCSEPGIGSTNRPNDGRRSAELLREPDEKSSGSPDVAEPIRVFVLDHFAADKLRAALTKPGERLVNVVHGEHDAQVVASVHRGVPVTGGY